MKISQCADNIRGGQREDVRRRKKEESEPSNSELGVNQQAPLSELSRLEVNWKNRGELRGTKQQRQRSFSEFSVHFLKYLNAITTTADDKENHRNPLKAEHHDITLKNRMDCG